MGYAIYDLAVGGGTLALAPMPQAAAPLLAWGADAVVSMTPDAELPRGLAQELAAAPVLWLHFPVADFGTPDAHANWDAVQVRVLAILADGGRVLVHCKGGCGRSGMAVLRLMIAAGEAPDAALARLRARRACAVETAAQMRWATGG